MNTLAFSYILPTTGRIPDFPCETCAAGRGKKKQQGIFFSGFFFVIYRYGCGGNIKKGVVTKKEKISLFPLFEVFPDPAQSLTELIPSGIRNKWLENPLSPDSVKSTAQVENLCSNHCYGSCFLNR